MAIKGYDLAPSNVRSAISEAARLEGVDEDTLTRIISRESTFNPQAANPKSSARGLAQFLDGTWADVTKRHGSKYGITAETSRFDARASALMAAAHLKDNAASLERSLGRAATGGETYAAHFLGAEGAAQMIKAAGSNPGAAAADLFPKAAKANASIFFEKDGVTKRSMSSVLADLTGGQGVTSSSPGYQGLSNIYGEVPVEPKKPFFEQLVTGYKYAAEQEQTQVMALQYLMHAGDEKLAPDPNFRWTEEMVERASADLPDKYADWVVRNAHSETHLEDLRKRAFHDIEGEQYLGEMGMAGNLGLRGAALLTDVPTWLIGFGAGKIAGAARLGRLATVGRAGLIAAAEQLPLSAMKMAERPGYDFDDALVDSASAFAFGSAFGVLGSGGKALDDHFSAAAAKAQRQELEGLGVPLSDKGKEYFAKYEAAAEKPGFIKPAYTSGGAAAVELPKVSPLDRFTFDIASRLQGRANTEVRELGLKLDQYIQGDGGETVRAGESAFEYARRVQEADGSIVHRADHEAFNSWAKRNGVPTHRLVDAWEDFEKHVAEAIIGRVDNVDPDVAKAAKTYQDAFTGRLRRAKAEGALGAEEIAEDANYFPVVYDSTKISAAVAKYGEDGVISVFRQALRSMQPKITEEVLDRVSSKIFKTVRSTTLGMHGNVAHAMSGIDRDALREFLEQAGVGAKDVEAFMAVEVKKQKTGQGNFRRRTLMNYDSKFVPDTDGIQVRDAKKVGRKVVPGPSRSVGKDDALSIRDLTDMNAARVWEKYNHSTAGHIAMHRAGFKTRSAFETHVDEVTLNRQDRGGYTPTHAKSDNIDLKYLGDRIYGVPSEAGFMGENSQRVGAIFNDVNFARNMGRAGLANLGDAPKIAQRTSLEAAVDTFRLADAARVLKRGGKEANQLLSDLEELTGVGTIRARTDIVPLWRGVEEFYPDSMSTRGLDVARRVTKTAANVVSLLGGMMPVNDFLGRWAVRAHLRHLVDITQGKRSVPNAVLNDLGLGRDEIARFKQLTDHMQVNERGSVVDLNLKKLREADAEGVDLLAAYLSRQARTTVLETSPAMLPRFMGTTAGRILGQFRSFSMASHVASTIHNVKMGPAYAANSLLVGGAWGYCVYLVDQYTKSIGRPDQDEYLEKAFSMDKVIGGVINRHADAGVVPALVDTAFSYLLTPLTGAESPFAYGRTSGLAAGINGIPAVDLGLSLDQAVRNGLRDASGNGVWTQQDAQNAARLLPLNNLFLVGNALKAATGGLPKSEPEQ